MLSLVETLIAQVESLEALGVLMVLYLVADLWLGTDKSLRLRALIMTAVFSAGAVLVLFNGYSPDGAAQFDLRFVVLMAASLFLPWQGSLTVAVVLIGARAVLGVNVGFFASTVSVLATWAACLVVVRKYAIDLSKQIAPRGVKAVAAASVSVSVFPVWVSFTVYYLSESRSGAAAPVSGWVAPLLAVSAMQVLGAMVLAGLIFLQGERSRANAQLQDFERRIRSILHAIPDLLLVQDRKGNYVDVLSGEGALIAEYSADIRGRNMAEFFSPEQVQERLALIGRALEGATVVKSLAASYCASQEARYLDLRLVPLDSDSVLILIRDVSDNIAIRKELNTRTEQLSLVLNHTQEVLGFLEPDGTVTCLTPNSCKALMGLPADEIKVRRLDDLMDGRHVRPFRNFLREFTEESLLGNTFECSITPAQGTSVWLELSLTRIFQGTEPSATRILLVARDITHRKSLEFFKRMSSQAFESLKDGIIVIDDLEGRIHWANKAFQDLSGYSDAQSHLQPLDKLLRSVASERPMPSTLDLVVSGQWQGEFLSQANDGRWFPEQRRVTFFEDVDSGNTFHVVVLRDLSHKKAAAQALEQLAHNDLLTGLPNRRAFLDELGIRLAKSLRASNEQAVHGVAVIVVDIAHFSNVNKSMGRQVGDLLLRQVAQGLKAHAPERAFVSRVEADEFAMIVPYTSAEGVTQVAREVLNFFDKPLKMVDREIFLSGYAGVSFTQSQPGHSELLLHEAHLALDDAMLKGERTIAFYDSMAAQRSHRNLLIENQLRKSLSEDPGSFYLKYQPKISLRDGAMVGVEALCRWAYGDDNRLTPADFIPVAEEAGLIDSLGAVVFERACQQIARWTREGTKPLSVAVNVSTQQLRDEGLPDKLLSISRKQGVLPSMIELEVTESAVMRDIDQAVESLQRLRRLGFKIALDDFGTGYSSMAYLQKLPLDTLKLDRSFVQNLGSDRSSEAICEAILALAQSVNLFTVAEGVETEEQRSFLAAKGCSAMQGYLVSPPVAPEQLEALRLRTQGAVSS